MNYRKSFLIIALAAILVISFTACKSSSGKVADSQKENWNTNYTYVFVHGLSGWGHYDAQNKFFPYWGKKNGSLKKSLTKLVSTLTMLLLPLREVPGTGLVNCMLSLREA